MSLNGRLSNAQGRADGSNQQLNSGRKTVPLVEVRNIDVNENDPMSDNVEMYA